MAIDKITTPAVTDDSVTLAKMAPGTDGNIISYVCFRKPKMRLLQEVQDNTALTSANSSRSRLPSFQASAVGGKVLQAVMVNKY